MVDKSPFFCYRARAITLAFASTTAVLRTGILMDNSLIAQIVNLIGDPSPRAIATMRYIKAILDGEVVIPGGMKSLLAELACDGRVNREIDDAHFPGADAFVSCVGVRPVDIGMDWLEADVFKVLDARGLKPTNPDKGLKWASKNKDVQRRNPLIIMGQKCIDGDGALCCIVLGQSVQRRRADLYMMLGRFERKYLVLAEPKE